MDCRCGNLAMNMFNRVGVEYAPSQQQHNLTVCRILNDYLQGSTETEGSHGLLVVYVVVFVVVVFFCTIQTSVALSN